MAMEASVNVIDNRIFVVAENKLEIFGASVQHTVIDISLFFAYFCSMQ